MNNTDRATMQSDIMEQITSGAVTMKPRWYFVVGSFLAAFGLFGTMFLTVYFWGMSWYRINRHSSLEYLWFGDAGQTAFIKTFPWLLLAVALFSLGVGLWLMQRFDFSYRFRWVWVAGGVSIGVLVAGYVVDRSGLVHATIQAPMMEHLDIHYGDSQGFYKALIEEREGTVIVVKTLDRRRMKVMWTEQTRMPFGAELHQGEWVIMVGNWQGEAFVAEGIGKVGDDYDD